MPADIRSFFGGSQGAAKPKAIPVKKEVVSFITAWATEILAKLARSDIFPTYASYISYYIMF